MIMIRKFILILLCIALFLAPVSGYVNIPVIGTYYYDDIYDGTHEVNVHLGDDADEALNPADPDTISYSQNFNLDSEPVRQKMRLVLNTVNVLPSAAKEEGVYDDFVYVNGVEIGKLNDLVGGAQQDYNERQAEFIFSSSLVNKGENTITIISGPNQDMTNYDDFSIVSIYMEQYGSIRHWLFSYVNPDDAVIILVSIFLVLAASGFYLHQSNKLPVEHQFLVAGGLGAILGFILVIKLQGVYFAIIFLIPIVIGIGLLAIGLAGLAAAKYLLHKDVLPKWFILLLNPLVLLIMALVSFFISYQYLFFDPGGPMPTYGVPAHRPEVVGEKGREPD